MCTHHILPSLDAQLRFFRTNKQDLRLRLVDGLYASQEKRMVFSPAPVVFFARQNTISLIPGCTKRGFEARQKFPNLSARFGGGAETREKYSWASGRKKYYEINLCIPDRPFRNLDLQKSPKRCS